MGRTQFGRVCKVHFIFVFRPRGRGYFLVVEFVEEVDEEKACVRRFIRFLKNFVVFTEIPSWGDNARA